MRAANVVNATGVWADRLRPSELHDEAELPRIRPSRGTHITLATPTCRSSAGAIVPAGGGRTIFALPWLGQHARRHDRQRLRGRPRARRRPPSEDIDYLLDAVNEFFATELGRGRSPARSPACGR